MELSRGPVFQENEQCVKDTINKMYWDAMDSIKKEEGDGNTGKYLFLGIAIVVMFAVALTLFVIYFKRQREDQAETTEGLTTASP